MFHEEFYPTPPSLVAKLLAGIDIDGCNILDPSAGSGNILDGVTNRIFRHSAQPKIYAIEIVPELQAILRQKKYRLIGDNFLNYSGDYLFDYILMNPPFSDGDKHLLHAWDVLKAGEIRCILPKTMIDKQFSSSRKLLANIIEQHGSIQDVGAPFRDAERRTPVECVIVTLKKQKSDHKLHLDFTVGEKPNNIQLDENTFQNAIATNDVVGNMIIQFDKAKESYIEFIQAFKKLEFYGAGLAEAERIALNTIATANHNTLRANDRITVNGAYNEFIDRMKSVIWSNVLDKTNVKKYMTSQVKQNFHEFAKEQGYMEFTKENVSNLVTMIFENRSNIMDQAIEQVFDIFTKYHSENRLHVEGWKTNSAWKVNRTVILPYFVCPGYNGNFNTEHRRWQEYEDIERVMCYISGTPYEHLTKPVDKQYEYRTPEYEKQYEALSLRNAIQRTKYGDSGWQESHFFMFRCFKKQTIHIKFKDEWLWKEFNMRACAHKNWLPASERKQWEATRYQKKI